MQVAGTCRWLDARWALELAHLIGPRRTLVHPNSAQLVMVHVICAKNGRCIVDALHAYRIAPDLILKKRWYAAILDKHGRLAIVVHLVVLQQRGGVLPYHDTVPPRVTDHVVAEGAPARRVDPHRGDLHDRGSFVPFLDGFTPLFTKGVALQGRIGALDDLTVGVGRERQLRTVLLKGRAARPIIETEAHGIASWIHLSGGISGAGVVGARTAVVLTCTPASRLL